VKGTFRFSCRATCTAVIFCVHSGEVHVRTFVAGPLPQGCQSLLAELQGKMRPLGADVRWMAIPSIHLTLKFLGEIDEAMVPRLVDSLRNSSAGESPFKLSLHGLGGFPNLRNPRVIWCGLSGDSERLGTLQSKVEQACEPLGFPPEEREFHPHLTLGRVQGKRNLQGVLDYIRIAPAFEFVFEVDRFHLYKSVLSPRGATYTVLDTIELTRI
jgi:RNA 2',3'-cyclic 3'-phosphodiesterase